MSKDFRLKLEKVFDFLGETIAFLTIALWVVCILNSNYAFLPEKLAAVFEIIKEWALLVLVAVEGFECTIKRNFVIRLIFYILLLIVVVYMFFPDTYSAIIAKIPSSK